MSFAYFRCFLRVAFGIYGLFSIFRVIRGIHQHFRIFLHFIQQKRVLWITNGRCAGSIHDHCATVAAVSGVIVRTIVILRFRSVRLLCPCASQDCFVAPAHNRRRPTLAEVRYEGQRETFHHYSLDSHKSIVDRDFLGFARRSFHSPIYTLPEWCRGPALDAVSWLHCACGWWTGLHIDVQSSAKGWLAPFLPVSLFSLHLLHHIATKKYRHDWGFQLFSEY